MSTVKGCTSKAGPASASQCPRSSLRAPGGKASEASRKEGSQSAHPSQESAQGQGKTTLV